VHVGHKERLGAKCVEESACAATLPQDQKLHWMFIECENKHTETADSEFVDFEGTVCDEQHCVGCAGEDCIACGNPSASGQECHVPSTKTCMNEVALIATRKCVQ